MPVNSSDSAGNQDSTRPRGRRRTACGTHRRSLARHL